jgi:peptide/nickel transport system permease protein
MKTQEEIIKKISFAKQTHKRLVQNKLSRVAFYLLLLIGFIGLFAPYIANDQPLCVTYKNKTFYPAFQGSWIGKNIIGFKNTDTIKQGNKKEIIQFDITDWRKMETEYILWPLIPFSPEKPDYYNRDYISPNDRQLVPTPDGKTIPATGKFRHILGTDDLGRDVLSGLIHGTRTSLLIGILSMIIAAIVGISIGVISGYFGDDKFKLTRIACFFFLPILISAYFIAFISRSADISQAFEISSLEGFFQFGVSFLILVTTTGAFIYLLNQFTFGWFGAKIAFPLDSILSRATEVFNSLPKLLLIISLTVVVEERSILLLIFIIGFTSWTEIARFTRAELLKIREQDYIQAAKALGLKNRQILFRHAIPNAMSSVFVSISFGIAAAILIESGLSFLGIGVPEDSVTWGSMLSHGKQEMEAWWLVIFPGMAIFITTVVFNLIGDGLREAMDPKLKR